MQVTKLVVQDNFEAGQVSLAAVVSAVSGAGSGSLAVNGNASTSTMLVQQAGVVVTITPEAGQPSQLNTAGVWWFGCEA